MCGEVCTFYLVYEVFVVVLFFRTSDMDLFLVCTFLFTLMLSRGSFSDTEKPSIDSGLEICILLSRRAPQGVSQGKWGENCKSS